MQPHVDEQDGRTHASVHDRGGGDRRHHRHRRPPSRHYCAPQEGASPSHSERPQIVPSFNVPIYRIYIQDRRLPGLTACNACSNTEKCRTLSPPAGDRAMPVTDAIHRQTVIPYNMSAPAATAPSAPAMLVSSGLETETPPTAAFLSRQSPVSTTIALRSITRDLLRPCRRRGL